MNIIKIFFLLSSQSWDNIIFVIIYDVLNYAVIISLFFGLPGIFIIFPHPSTLLIIKYSTLLKRYISKLIWRWLPLPFQVDSKRCFYVSKLSNVTLFRATFFRWINVDYCLKYNVRLMNFFNVELTKLCLLGSETYIEKK